MHRVLQDFNKNGWKLCTSLDISSRYHATKRVRLFCIKFWTKISIFYIINYLPTKLLCNRGVKTVHFANRKECWIRRCFWTKIVKVVLLSSIKSTSKESLFTVYLKAQECCFYSFKSRLHRIPVLTCLS